MLSAPQVLAVRDRRQADDASRGGGDECAAASSRKCASPAGGNCRIQRRVVGGRDAERERVLSHVAYLQRPRDRGCSWRRPSVARVALRLGNELG